MAEGEPIRHSRPGHGCRRYDGKVALVTASTMGIGYAIARRFAEEGAAVVVSSRKEASSVFSLLYNLYHNLFHPINPC